MLHELLNRADAHPDAHKIADAIIAGLATAISAAQTVELIGGHTGDVAQIESKLKFVADAFAAKIIESIYSQ